ncbi:unnamed protein product [Cyprideis torosa]|uniref:Uncharacterized protein n=1 Tax=Cyprideis torosa TaxID=163714 RepID=A0A7R8ZIK4_9CRUS|nr:unnamed protein product [Cyprideis torosa]CAG0880163.1 unnamed protein product [Cyprideis torosa]
MSGKVGNQTNSQDPQAINSRVFVGNLNTFQVSKSDLERIFQRYGRIAGISMHRGYAFVQFTNPFDARSACMGEDVRNLAGQILDVNMVAEPKPHQIGRKRQNLNKTGNDWEYYYDSYCNAMGLTPPSLPTRLIPPMKRPRLVMPGSGPKNHGIHQKNIQITKATTTVALNQLKTYSSPDILICGNCREMFSDIGGMIEHKRTYCKLRFTCKCGNNGINKNALSVAPAAASLVCVFCKEGFHNAWDLMVHVQSAHMVNFYELGAPLQENGVRAMSTEASPGVSPADNTLGEQTQDHVMCKAEGTAARAETSSGNARAVTLPSSPCSSMKDGASMEHSQKESNRLASRLLGRRRKYTSWLLGGRSWLLGRRRKYTSWLRVDGRSTQAGYWVDGGSTQAGYWVDGGSTQAGYWVDGRSTQAGYWVDGGSTQAGYWVDGGSTQAGYWVDGRSTQAGYWVDGGSTQAGYWVDGGSTQAGYWVDGRSTQAGYWVDGGSTQAGYWVDGGSTQAGYWVDGRSTQAGYWVDGGSTQAGYWVDGGSTQAGYWVDGRSTQAGYWVDGGSTQAGYWVDGGSTQAGYWVDGRSTQAGYWVDGGSTQAGYWVDGGSTQAGYWVDGRSTQAGYWVDGGSTQAGYWVDGGSTQAGYWVDGRSTQAGYWVDGGGTQAGYWVDGGGTQAGYWVDGGGTQAGYWVDRGGTQTGYWVDGGGTQAGYWVDGGGTQTGYWVDGGGTQAGYWVDGGGTQVSIQENLGNFSALPLIMFFDDDAPRSMNLSQLFHTSEARSTLGWNFPIDWEGLPMGICVGLLWCVPNDISIAEHGKPEIPEPAAKFFLERPPGNAIFKVRFPGNPRGSMDESNYSDGGSAPGGNEIEESGGIPTFYLDLAKQDNPILGGGLSGGGGGFGGGGGYGKGKGKGMPYSFQYGVRDNYYGNDYGHQESSDGQQTKGSYRVKLPDGRTMYVTYFATHKSGFNAQVKFQGKAKFPPPKKYKKKFQSYHDSASSGSGVGTNEVLADYSSPSETAVAASPRNTLRRNPQNN